MKDYAQKLALEEMRRDFIANISHELRTPLTVIHGYLETLLEQKLDDTKPWKRIFFQMYQQTMRMENIIGDLLLLARLENPTANSRTYKEVILAPIIRSVYKEAMTLSGEHEFHLDIDINLAINGDKDELRSMLSNLVSNAIKYTPSGGHIYIDWQKQGEEAILAVRDTGIGIAKTNIPRLTERFYRVDKARSRASGGTGLGLAIVKHVLIRHNATLTIESEPGKGSNFTCIFT